MNSLLSPGGIVPACIDVHERRIQPDPATEHASPAQGQESISGYLRSDTCDLEVGHLVLLVLAPGNPANRIVVARRSVDRSEPDRLPEQVAQMIHRPQRWNDSPPQFLARK